MNESRCRVSLLDGVRVKRCHGLRVWASLALLLPFAAAAEYTFTDVTADAGVANGDHPHFGATWSDYDKDGWLDLYVVNDNDNTLYRNLGDGTFVDVTAETGAGDPFVAMRNVWADYDQDGDLDFYSHNFVQSTLYQNNNNVFTDVNAESGAGVAMPNGTGAAWVDYDNDGWLDLHGTGFPAGWNVLLRNNGDGTFSDTQPISGLPFDADGMGTAWADYDNDGDQDLGVAAVTPLDPNFLYRNEGDGTFTHVTESANIVVEPGSSTSAINWVDYDNDGWLDLQITEVDLGSEKQLPEKYYLFRNLADGTFEDVTSAAGLDIPQGVEAEEFWDAAFADYDNDGDQDLYVGVVGPNMFYQNNGDGTFTDIAAELGLDSEIEGKGIAWGDYDNDGDLDLYLVQRHLQNQPLVPNILFKNDGGSNHWLQVELIGDASNVDAIGARLTATLDGASQIREINGGTGFFVQHTPIQQFGFGATEATTVDVLEIRWPSGIVDVLNDVPLDARITVVEGETVIVDPSVRLTVDSLGPNRIRTGAMRPFTLIGTGFTEATNVALSRGSNDVEIVEIRFVDDQHIDLIISAAADAVQGSRDIMVNDPENGRSRLEAALMVMAPPQ